MLKLFLRSGFQSPCRTTGQPGQQTSPGHIGAALRSFVLQTEVFCITELASASQMEFLEKHLVILSRRAIRVSVNLPGKQQAARFWALDAKIGYGDGGHPSSTPTSDLWEECRHQMLGIIYSNACERSLDNDTSIKCSLNLRGLFI